MLEILYLVEFDVQFEGLRLQGLQGGQNWVLISKDPIFQELCLALDPGLQAIVASEKCRDGESEIRLIERERESEREREREREGER